MNSKNLLLVLAAVLVLIGLTKPDFTNIIKPNNNVVVNDLVIDKPQDEVLLEKCDAVISALKKDKDRTTDGKRLASLYLDMSKLIELNAEDTVIRNTDEIRQANSLAGLMLKLDIKGKYPELAKANEELLVTAIGNDSVLLSPELRESAIKGFLALAWACNEGSK